MAAVILRTPYTDVNDDALWEYRKHAQTRAYGYH